MLFPETIGLLFSGLLHSLPFMANMESSHASTGTTWRNVGCMQVVMMKCVLLSDAKTQNFHSSISRLSTYSSCVRNEAIDRCPSLGLRGSHCTIDPFGSFTHFKAKSRLGRRRSSRQVGAITISMEVLQRKMYRHDLTTFIYRGSGTAEHVEVQYLLEIFLLFRG
jgi:hypothetical protein